MSQEGDKKTQEAVYIYEAPVRIWHWINALAIVVLCISGYLIGSPLPSTGGEAYDHYVMGTVRWVHFASAYIVIVGFVFRFYWAFVGNKNAQEVFTPFIWSLKWWKEVWHEVKWYAMIEREPMKYYGHNPLARDCHPFPVRLDTHFHDRHRSCTLWRRHRRRQLAE